MSEDSLNTVSDLVIHRLVREAQGASRVVLRAGQNPLDEPALRLMERLCQSYAARPGKGYGHFEQEGAGFPMPGLVRQLVVEQRIDFARFQQEAMAVLQARVEEDQIEDGGYLVVARVSMFGADCLWFALIQDVLGSAILEGGEIVDAPQLDIAGIQVAGRIDLTAWQAGAERYISFLKGRGDVAGYFKRFLGCTDVVIALKETRKLVETLEQFAEAQALPPPARDTLLERAHEVLEAMGERSAPVSLETVAAEVWPEAPEKLVETLQEESRELATGFVPDKRALRPLVRFRAKAQGWRLEFDRAGLSAGTVQYDAGNNTLILTNVPESLKRSLLDE